MPARIRFEVEGKVQFDRIFRRLDERFEDLSPIWDDVRDAVWEIEAEQFQSSGSKGESGRWKDLSERYEAQKIARYGTFAVIAGPLRATDAMYKSLTRQTEHTIYRTDKTNFALGTSLPYAKFHQRGGGNLPQREIFSFSEIQKKGLQKTIQKSLIRELRKGSVYVEAE